MKLFVLILSTFFIIACNQEGKEKKVTINNIDSNKINETKNFSFEKEPAKTIMNFLKWYKSNYNIQSELVNNASNETWDSLKYYSVNFKATEIYLNKLKSTGFISDKYINKWRSYFVKSEKDFKENPSNDGPPRGFEYDFILLIQEYDDCLNDINQLNIISLSQNSDYAIMKIAFPTGNYLTYVLSKYDDKWKIDDIKS